MRGVKYNLKFTEVDKSERTYNDLLIRDCMSKLEQIIKDTYNIEMKVSKHMIYNLIHRPTKSNRFIRQLCKIEFSNREMPQLNSQN